MSDTVLQPPPLHAWKKQGIPRGYDSDHPRVTGDVGQAGVAGLFGPGTPI